MTTVVGVSRTALESLYVAVARVTLGWLEKLDDWRAEQKAIRQEEERRAIKAPASVPRPRLVSISRNGTPPKSKIPV